jgi:hypothetical protein
MIKSNPFVNVRNYIKMHFKDVDKSDLKVLFYRKIDLLLLSKACEEFEEFKAFLNLRNFSTVDILGLSHKSLALLEIVLYVCSPF